MINFDELGSGLAQVLYYYLKKVSSSQLEYNKEKWLVFALSHSAAEEPIKFNNLQTRQS